MHVTWFQKDFSLLEIRTSVTCLEEHVEFLYSDDFTSDPQELCSQSEALIHYINERECAFGI